MTSAASDPWSTHDLYDPFGEDLKFMLWLTPQEWQLCYGLSFALQLAEWMGMELSLGESFRDVIRRLQREECYTWSGIYMAEDDVLWPRYEKAISPPNKLWLFQLSENSAPDYSVHIPAAIDFLKRKLEGSPNYNNYLDCLTEAENKIHDDFSYFKEATEGTFTEKDIEKMKEAARERQFAIQQALATEEGNVVN